MPKAKKTNDAETGGGMPHEERIEQGKDVRILAAIGYVWILCLLPLLGKRDSGFAQFHGKQGLVLTIASFIVGLVIWIPIVGFFAWIAAIGLIALAVTGVRNAMEGKYWEMPILGKYAKEIKL